MSRGGEGGQEGGPPSSYGHRVVPAEGRLSRNTSTRPRVDLR